MLRYVDVETGATFECFLTYVEVVSYDAQGLSMYILHTLKHPGLDITYIVFQGYDSASAMSGKCSGVQQCIKEVALQALHVHCLNLALVDIHYQEHYRGFSLLCPDGNTVCFYV